MKTIDDKSGDTLRDRIPFLVSLKEKGQLDGIHELELIICKGLEMLYLTKYPLSEDIFKAIKKYETAMVLHELGTSEEDKVPVLLKEAWKEIEPHAANAENILIE